MHPGGHTGLGRTSGGPSGGTTRLTRGGVSEQVLPHVRGGHGVLHGRGWRWVHSRRHGCGHPARALCLGRWARGLALAHLQLCPHGSRVMFKRRRHTPPGAPEQRIHVSRRRTATSRVLWCLGDTHAAMPHGPTQLGWLEKLAWLCGMSFCRMGLHSGPLLGQSAAPLTAAARGGGLFKVQKVRKNAHGFARLWTLWRRLRGKSRLLLITAQSGAQY